MPYITPQNLTDRGLDALLIELTDVENLGVINSTVLGKAIDAATGRIDRYLAAYLPLVNVPEDFEQMACDLTLYFLYKNRNALIPDAVMAGYKDAMAYLADLRDSGLGLPPDNNGIVDAKTSDDVAYQSETPVFLGGGLSDF